MAMQGPTKASDLPAHHLLQARPVHERRDLPIPAVNVHLAEEEAARRFTGEFESAAVDLDDPAAFVKFDAIYAPNVVVLALNRLCALCRQEFRVACFIGGQSTLDTGRYNDGPMHAECALAALTLCPHLRLNRHRRTGETRRMAESGEIEVEARGERQFVVLARGYHLEMSDQHLAVIVPLESRLGVETYRYVDGEIERESSMGLRLDQIPEGM